MVSKTYTSIWGGSERSCKGTREVPEVTSYTKVIAKVHAPSIILYSVLQHTRNPTQETVSEADRRGGRADGFAGY